jgi:hypothetical protein
LHQHQREIKTIQHNGQQVEYIEVTLEDIETANQLAHEVLGRTLDELPPQTRRLLGLIHEHVRKQCLEQGIDQRDYRFSRREVREYSAWGNTQLKTHLKRLEELEYLILHRGGRGQTFVYELAYQGKGEDGDLFLMGLLETKRLKITKSEAETTQNPAVGGKKSGVNGNWSGQKSNLSGSSRGQVAPKSGGGRGENNRHSPEAEKDAEKNEEKQLKRTSGESKKDSHFSLPDANVPELSPLTAQSSVQAQQPVYTEQNQQN